LLWSDPLVWRDVPEDAGYVHSLAIRRAYAGRGLGKTLLEWAERLATAGKRYLRLDCGAENLPLRAYYERLGFQHRGDLAEGDGFRASLHQRRLPEALSCY
jgi:ribosomal protein S18 acetylase RimI-like enzyme